MRGALFRLARVQLHLPLYFTKHDGPVSDRKKIRNIIYRACGWGMVATGALLFILRLFMLGWIVMVAEIILLQLFGISWLTKGGLIFPDKKQGS